jgi:hypothetical protein
VNNIKVKKKIKFPESTYGRNVAGADAKWPLMDLEVDDGFEAPISSVNSIRCSIQHFQR